MWISGMCARNESLNHHRSLSWAIFWVNKNPLEIQENQGVLVMFRSGLDFRLRLKEKSGFTQEFIGHWRSDKSATVLLKFSGEPNVDPCPEGTLFCVDRRKFWSQTSDNMDRWKSRGGKSQRGEEKKWEDQRRERERRKKMQVREKVGKSRFTVFFEWFVAQEGQKVGSLKRRVEPSGQMRDEKLHAVVARSTFWSKKGKIISSSEHFYSGDVEKVHAVVARSTFPSQNVQSTPGSDHCWKLRCRKKSTPLWREAHFQVKLYKHQMYAPLFEVQMFKMCTLLWREAHFQVKMYKARHVRTTFGSGDVEKVYAVVVRSTFPSQNVQSTPGSDHFWKLRCRKNARRCGAKHISKSKCTKHAMCGPLLEVEMSKNARRCGAKRVSKSEFTKN